MGLDISFSEEDLDRIMHPHEDPLVISTDIGPNSTLNKVIIDNGNSVDVLYYDAFIQMGYKREDLKPQKEAIYWFTNIAAPITGVISLKTSVGKRKSRISKTTKFVVVEVVSEINAILVHPFIHGIKGVPSSYH